MIDSMIHTAFLFFSSYKILTGNRFIKNKIWRLNTGTKEARCACNTRTFPDLYITFDTPKSSWPVSLISSKIVYLTVNEGPVRIQYKWLVPIYVFQNRIIMFFLPAVPALIYLWEIYIFPGSVCLFCCMEICGPILGIYKSLSDTWMWKLWLRPRNSQKRNI